MAIFLLTFHNDGKISPAWWGMGGVHAFPLSLCLPSIATPPISPLPYMYSEVKNIKGNGLTDRKSFKKCFSAVRHSFTVNSKTNIYFCGYKARKGGRFCGFFTHHKANKEWGSYYRRGLRGRLLYTELYPCRQKLRKEGSSTGLYSASLTCIIFRHS